jgi:hypothetical protein
MARLSDRPSSDRDMSFLFRIAAARALAARPMLESLAQSPQLSDESAIRAASLLARDHGRDDLRAALAAAATGARREELKGLAVAALWDAGSRDEARAFAEELVESRHIGNVAWASIVRAAAAGAGRDEVLVSETRFRWIQLGWLE